MKDENTDIHGDLTAALPIGRDSKTGQFLPGHPGPCLGRGASGRTKALRILDAVLSASENQQKLQEAMQAAFDRNPVRFFRTIIVPLLPREARMEVETAGAVLWTRISEAFPPSQE